MPAPYFYKYLKDMKRLSEIKIGKKVVIRSFEKDDLFIKLMEMGCIPGEIIKIEQKAPLGDPISISVAGYSLSLRLNEADHIFVEETE
jgi:ferrous iron transport protein A